MNWATVYTGPLWEAITVSSVLQAAGFTTFVPDSNTKAIDPFITGCGALDAAVLVPEDAAADAAALLAERDHDEEVETAPVDEREEATERLRLLGRRVAFSAGMVFTMPYTLVLAVRYFDGCAQFGVRPPNHRWVMGATAIAALFVTAILGMILTGFAVLPR